MYLNKQNTFCLSLVTALCLSSALALEAANPAGRNEFVRDNKIWGTKEAADLVQMAQEFEPGGATPNREKVITLYTQAIAAQPGARINAHLCEHVAQLLTFIDFPGGIKPDPVRAKDWWKKCIESSDPNQLLWAQAQMGAASSSVMRRDMETALDAYKAILSVDASKLTLPDWQELPPEDTEWGKEARQQLRAQIEQSVPDMKNIAIERICGLYLGRYGPEAAIESMKQIADQYAGTPVEKRALELQKQVAKNPKLAGNWPALDDVPRVAASHDPVIAQPQSSGNSQPPIGERGKMMVGISFFIGLSVGLWFYFRGRSASARTQ
jgi:hypothetical protein